MSNKPIKTDIFRFVTMRSPNHLGVLPTSSKGFIYPPVAVVQSLQNTANTVAKSNALSALSTLVGPFITVQQVRDVNPDVYDYSCKLYQQRNTVRTLHDDGISPLTVQQEEQIWSQLLYQAIWVKSKYVRQACVQMLLANHYLTYKTWADTLDKIQELFFAKVVISEDIITMRRDLVLKKCPSQGLMGVTNLGIADFRRVEQELCCYVPGEVSHIENVMKQEYKERSTRSLTRSETTLELSSETETEKLTDTTTASRHELSSEIAKVLTEDQSQNYGGSLGVSGEKFGVKIDVNAHLDFASANSSSISNTNAEQYAEEVTKRALERVVRKTSEKRTFKMLREFEENNRHGFDNRGEKAQNVSSIYRWTDKIYKNQVVNYGKRLMLEFVIPEPARFLKNAMSFVVKTEKEEGTSTTTLPPEPTKLVDIRTQPTRPGGNATIPNGIRTATDINGGNYQELAAMYGITIAVPKDQTQSVQAGITGNLEHSQNGNKSESVNVPQDYELTSTNGSYTYKANNLTGIVPPWNPRVDDVFKCIVADKTAAEQIGVIWSGTTSDQLKGGNLNNLSFSPAITTSFQIKVLGTFVSNFDVSVICNFTLKPSIVIAWQNKAYTDLQAAYNAKLKEYEDAVKAQQAAEAAEAEAANVGAGSANEKKATNPAFNRITEQRELKRAAIEMLMHPFCTDLGQKMYTTTDCCGNIPVVPDPKDPKAPPVEEKLQIPFITQTDDLVKYGQQVRFFEQAFEWDIMSYLFYPYYWADKCAWAELLKEEDSDLIFQAFKQAGMARLVVPVRVESTEAVLYYMETGDIWTGGDIAPETADGLHLSIVKDMQQVLPAPVGTPWETRVPSTLTILQDSTAGIKGEGLPCWCRGHESEFEVGEDVLSPLKVERAYKE
jgi:hypothetical protein